MEECAKQIDELLAEKAEMLDEYFGVRIKVNMTLISFLPKSLVISKKL